MSTPESSADALAAAEELIGRLALRYAAQWLRLYDGFHPDAVKADWAAVLAGISPEAIRWGMGNLPADRPPNALQFRALCRSMPARGEQLRLGPPLSAMPPSVKAKLTQVRERIAGPRAAPAVVAGAAEQAAAVQRYAREHGLSLDTRAAGGQR